MRLVIKLDLPDNPTNEDVLDYTLRKVFPRTIFIRSHNVVNETYGIHFSEEWKDAPFKGVKE